MISIENKCWTNSIFAWTSSKICLCQYKIFVVPVQNIAIFVDVDIRF